MKACLTLLTVLLLLFSSAALGEAAPQATEAPAAPVIASGAGPSVGAGSLTALGSARVSVQPDTVVLTLSVTDTATTVTEAQAATTATLDGLYVALEPLKVKREDISTSYYSVTTQFNYQYGKLGETETPSGYCVQSDVVITLRDVSLVSQVIDIALQNGTDNSYDLRFESSQTQVAYDMALRLAVQEAMRKASLLADASKETLADVISIRELNGVETPAFVMHSLSDGQTWDSLSYVLNVEATVEVTYGVE